MNRLAVIITTYNTWPELARCLAAYERQNRIPDLVTIADDGSTPPPDNFFEHFPCFPEVKHVWQPDFGFRQSRILNLAASFSDADHLVITDGDCLPHRNFVRDHESLLARGKYVQGTRAEVLAKIRESFVPSFPSVMHAMWSGGMVARIRGLRLPRPLRRFHWGGPLFPCSCNLSCWKDDFVAVNGFDEEFAGWGCIDNDFVRRLRLRGLECQTALGCCVLFHLDHPSSRGLSPNRDLMERRKIEGANRAPLGYDATTERGEVRCSVYRNGSRCPS